MRTDDGESSVSDGDSRGTGTITKAMVTSKIECPPRQIDKYCALRMASVPLLPYKSPAKPGMAGMRMTTCASNRR